jgi:hypothetical protein
MEALHSYFSMSKWFLIVCNSICPKAYVQAGSDWQEDYFFEALKSFSFSSLLKLS